MPSKGGNPNPRPANAGRSRAASRPSSGTGARRAVRRTPISESEKRRVWAAAAGRCEICGADLLEGRITHRPMTLGQLAHIVGAQRTEGSPRGMAAMSGADRNKAENLLLICADHHDEIDRDGALDIVTIERLQALKRDREAWIEQVTALGRDRGTAIVRLLANLRGNSLEIPRDVAAAAVLRCDSRFADFPLAMDRYGVEIDLRQLPGEAAPDADYWRTGMAKVDEVVRSRVVDGILTGRITHLSIFAFARLPLLVYLGSQLDDNIKAEVYQRQRSTGGWVWVDDRPIRFTTSWSGDLTATDEAVLILNVSGTIAGAELPTALAGKPQLRLSPEGEVPAPDILTSRARREAFEAAVRAMFADIEVSAKRIRRLHVFAALPVAAAVALGQAHDPHLRPALAVYARDDATASYTFALEIA